MIVSIFEQNGTAVGFKQYTNNRLACEYYKAPADSTNEIDKHTVGLAKPGLEALELFGMIIPYSIANHTPEEGEPVTLYCYSSIGEISQVVYDGVVRDGLYALFNLPIDLKAFLGSMGVRVYDNVTGRFITLSKGETEFFESFLEYREKVRKGEIVDEH